LIELVAPSVHLISSPTDKISLPGQVKCVNSAAVILRTGQQSGFFKKPGFWMFRLFLPACLSEFICAFGGAAAKSRPLPTEIP
jgi:hypothetical protein